MSKLSRELKRSLSFIKGTEYEKRTGKIDYAYRLGELKYAALDTLIYSWYTPLEIFYESVSRILGFLPVIWKHRDWDFSYSFTLFAYSLKRLRTNIELYGHHLHQDRDIKNIKIAEELIKRLMEDDYCLSEYSDHKAKWGYRLFSPSNLNAKQQEQSNKEFKAIMNKAEQLKANDWEALCKMLTKHSQQWWD